MKAEEIKVGKVYRGPRTEMSEGQLREVTFKANGKVAIRLPLDYRAVPWEIPLDTFATWAKEEVS